MKKLLIVLLSTVLTGCASFQFSTINHKPEYVLEGSDVNINVIKNELQLRNLLRTDFNFRYDYAQYAISQPISFDWNNRLLGYRYNYYNPYYSRSQMWTDWVWGYTWNSPHRWSPFGYDRWGYNNYGYGIGWSYSWNNRRWSSNQWGNNYGWNNGFYNRYRGTNVAYHSGRRSGVGNTNGRAHAAMIQSTKEVKVKKRRTVNTNNNDKTIRTNPRVIQRPESSGNGRGSRVRQVTPIEPIIPRQPRTVQPRQIRRGSQSSVPQQTRTRSSSNQQRRSSSPRRKN